MTILVTAASGHLGRLVLDSLLERGVDPAEIRAGARRTDSLAQYAERGVQVVPLDYDDAGSVKAAVDGVERVLLISGSEVGQRIAQHATVVDAAATAGVSQLVYTSAPRATDTALVLAPEHKATEEHIAAVGVPATILRNNWYTENYAQDLDVAREHGVLVTSAGDGRVPSAARADFADAAAVVLTQEGHVGQVYELAGDVAWDFPTLAAVMSEVLDREVVLQQLAPEERVAQLQQVGVDAGTAGFVAALEGNLRDGVLDHGDGTLSRLIGRPTTPLIDTLRTLSA